MTKIKDKNMKMKKKKSKNNLTLNINAEVEPVISNELKAHKKKVKKRNTLDPNISTIDNDFTDKKDRKLEEKNVDNKFALKAPKVPHFYREAAQILGMYRRKEGFLKTLVLKSKCKNKAALLGLMNKVVANENTIQTILKSSKVLKKYKKNNTLVLEVVLSELLWRGALQGNFIEAKLIAEHKDELLGLMKTSKLTLKEPEFIIPRWVRINTLKTDKMQVHRTLNHEGFTLINYDKSKTTYEDFLKLASTLEQDQYLKDYHIPNLLVFAPKTSFFDSDLYHKGSVVLQDKGSCLPVYLSGISQDCTIIDACAAPGNKLSYAAAVVKNKSKIVATEYDEKRFHVLQKLALERGVKCEFLQQDFTKMNIEEYGEIECIFIDPSCSSTGAQGRNFDENRLKNLSAFQFNMLSYALSFPNVKSVVYSTCSITEEENENVVADVLNRYGEDYVIEDLSLKMTGWKNFGLGKYKFGKKCIRSGSDDLCQGFFVAKFIRRDLVDVSEEIIYEEHFESEIATEKRENKKKFACLSEQTFSKDYENVFTQEKNLKKKRKSEQANCDDSGVCEQPSSTENEISIAQKQSLKKKRKSKLTNCVDEDSIFQKESSKKKPNSKEGKCDDSENITELVKTKKKKKKQLVVMEAAD